MEKLIDIITRQQAARPSTEDPVIEKLAAEIMSLAEEVCVLRDRLDTCQRLAPGAVNDEAIDNYVVDAAATEQRLARHRKFFEALFERLAPT